jgi:predicted amidohydrolase/GNAT superfamily N-acetyltransferase
MPRKNGDHTPKLLVRRALPSDVPALVELTARIYTAEWGHSAEMLYGMEVVVHPDYRNMRIGRRLYQARKRLCTDLKLRGIAFGGRIPGLARNIGRYGSAEAYVQAVVDGRRRDQTLSFQLSNGFEVVGILRDYVPADHESLGYAALLKWTNPRLLYEPDIAPIPSHQRIPDSVRVASVQYQQRRIRSFEEFATQVEYFTDIAADYNADFVTFPELITLQLLSIENEELSPVDTIHKLSQYTAQVKELFGDLAMRYNINIIAGSHPTEQPNGDIHNVCYVCLRDGSIHEREKLHVTPSERNVWHITGGESAATIPTDCGPIGVMICYDAEFPEVARHLSDQGALLLSGNVGNLPGVNNFDIQYGQSCILTPSDFLFSRDGIAADTTPNTETVLFADLRLDYLARARNAGAVQNLRDRRFDLYESRWARAREGKS